MQDSPKYPDPNETGLEDAVAPHSEAASASPAVSVDIYDQTYHLRGVDPEYIEGLAAMVNEKMRAVSAHGGTVDSLRVAVLAALNIADELCTVRQQYDELAGAQQSTQSSLQSRAHSLAGMLDELLEDRRVG